MTYNYKHIVEGDNNTIEITSSPAGLATLRRSDNKNTKVCLPLSLCIGKIDLTPFNRKVLKEYFKDDNSYDFRELFNNLKELINNTNKIRVWSSHLDSNDYLLLLLICYLYKDKNISVTFSDEIDKQAYSLGFVTELEVPSLEEKEHTLSEEEKVEYSNEWIKIVNDNKEFRYILNNKITSTDIDAFDKNLLNRLSNKGIIYINEFIADLLVNPLIPNVIDNTPIYIYLINILEEKGLIKSSIENNKKYIELA